MADTQYWDSRRGRIFSSKGGWRIGEGVYSHGFNMMDDLVGKISYMQLIVLHATGRLPEKRLADWLEAIFICLSWPDPRIWCNAMGALGGTSGTSPVAATCAGMLATDSRLYGTKVLVDGASFIQKALKDKKNGAKALEIVNEEIRSHGGKPSIIGYARPVARGDERVVAMEKVARNLEFEIGEHLDLAYEIEAILSEKYDENMNINGYASAFLSDQGCAPYEIYRISTTVVSSGVTACYVEEAGKPSGSFSPLRCDDVEYRGIKQRSVPVKSQK